MSLRYLFSVPLAVWREPSNRGERLKRLLMSVGWQVWKRLGMPPIIYTLDNRAQFVLDPASGNSVGAIYTKIYSSRHVTFVREHLIRGGTIVDVGAHAGLYTLLFSHLVTRAEAFEPAPDTLALLRRNVALNALPTQIHACAVGARAGEAFLTLTGENSGTNFLGQSGLRVPLVALDDFDFGDVSLLKIDVEGGEMGVLEGAGGLLQRNRSAVVQIEISGDRQPVVDVLRGHGYRVFGLTEEGEAQPYASGAHLCDDLIAFGPDHPYRQ